MALIIKKEDFDAEFTIAQNCYSDLDKYINKFETLFLQELLGCNLFESFKSNLDKGKPTSDIYLKLFNSFCLDDGSNQIISQGMTQLLVGLIYYEFVRYSSTDASQHGVTVNRVETSRQGGFNEHDLYTRYNGSIDSFKAIQHYICKNRTVYPSYNGQSKTYNHWSF